MVVAVVVATVVVAAIVVAAIVVVVFVAGNVFIDCLHHNQHVFSK